MPIFLRQLAEAYSQQNKHFLIGHFMGRDKCHITCQTRELVVKGTIPRGRPKLRWLDRIKVDLKEVSAQEVSVCICAYV